MRNVENTCGNTNWEIGKWLDQHPRVNTVVVVANHAFRGVGMYAMMEVLPGSYTAKCLVSLGASVFYRVTIERFCRFRFALLACAGGAALKMSLRHLNRLVTEIASRSIGIQTLAGVAPLAIYIGAVVWTSYLDVQGSSKESCCIKG